jgi:predicted transcriptional regulator
MTVHEEKSRAEHLTLRLDEKLVSELRRVALANDRSVSAEARRAIRDYLRQFALQEEAA